MKTGILIIFLSFQLFFVTSIHSQDLNTNAPEFSANDLNGDTIKLSDLKGKVILIDFWASWCVPCKKSMPHLIKLYNNKEDSSFAVITVNVDEERSKIEKFANSINAEFPFPVIFDKDSKLPVLYNVEGMPTTVIIDKEGIIRFKEAGFTDKIKEKMDSKIKELLAK